jgi:hypothetical protein
MTYRQVGVVVPRALYIPSASCAESSMDPDEWFPSSDDTREARREAAGAIAVCNTCPVRIRCLEYSLRYWSIGRHGIWGGLVPAERELLRWNAYRT